MSFRHRSSQIKTTRTLDDVLAVGLASQQSPVSTSSVGLDDDFDAVDQIDAIFGIDEVSIDARQSGKSVGQVLLGYLENLRLENRKMGVDGKVFYALIYDGITIGKIYFFGKMGFRAWMTHAKYYGPVQEIEKQYITQPTPKRMLNALGRLLQKLKFARVIRKIEWKLVK